jgi:hypothetical protein
MGDPVKDHARLEGPPIDFRSQTNPIAASPVHPREADPPALPASSSVHAPRRHSPHGDGAHVIPGDEFREIVLASEAKPSRAARVAHLDCRGASRLAMTEGDASQHRGKSKDGASRRDRPDVVGATGIEPVTPPV